MADAVRQGRTSEVVDELMEALRYDPGPVAGMGRGRAGSKKRAEAGSG